MLANNWIFLAIMAMLISALSIVVYKNYSR
jgi:hypothetical protein